MSTERARSQKSTAGARAFACCALLSAVACGALEGCAPHSRENEETVIIGLLLPFTGTSSATSSNFERAVLYAADRVNEAGGIQGKRLRIVARDTHSETERSQLAAEQLVAEGASAVLGVESVEIAEQLLPTFRDNGVAFMSPLVGAAASAESTCDHPWYRLAPSAASLGEALAKRLVAEQVARVAVLHTDDAYQETFSSALERRFVSLGGEVALSAHLEADSPTQGETIRETIKRKVEAVVLAAPPRTGAQVIGEYQAVSAELPRWFLSPLLKTEVFVQNVSPRAIEGALGVAPKIYASDDAFARAFRERWLGDEPLEGAYFYFDAVGLLALALERAQLDAGGKAEQSSLEAALLQAAAPPGEAVGWDEIGVGLRRLREGSDIYYSGLTGPMLLDPCGPRRLGVASTWSVRDGKIVAVDGE